jgi:hypothetical protein
MWTSEWRHSIGWNSDITYVVLTAGHCNLYHKQIFEGTIFIVSQYIFVVYFSNTPTKKSTYIVFNNLKFTLKHLKHSSQMKHQLDATLCRFYFCRVNLHVSGASAHHQEYLKLVQRPLVHVLSLQVCISYCTRWLHSFCTVFFWCSCSCISLLPVWHR